MRLGCTRGRRQANVWYSGPANGILIDGWAEEIVGLQTAVVGLSASRGLRRQEIAGTGTTAKSLVSPDPVE
jgi:hypothetical protein